MSGKNQVIEASRFKVIFQKLEEAKNEQDANLAYCLDQASEANETIALFKEYQESLIQSSYTIFTRV